MYVENMQKIPFGEGQVQDPIWPYSWETDSPYLIFKFSASPRGRNVEKIGNRRTDGQRNDFNRAHFFKNVL
jgi:hypothetical protein